MAFTIVVNLASITVLSAFLAYIYHNTPKTELLHYYSWMHFCAIMLLLGNLFSFLAPGFPEKFVTTVITSVISLCFSISFLLFSLYYNKSRHMSPAVLISLAVIPLIFTLLIFLTDRSLFLVEGGNEPHYGPFYVALSGTGYFLQFLGCVNIISGLTRKINNSFFKLLLMIFALASFSLQFMFNVTSPEGFVNLHPVLVLTIFTAIFIGAVKLGLFNTMSVGVRSSLELYNEAVLVLDKRGGGVYSNLAYKELDSETANSIVSTCRGAIPSYRWKIGEEKFFETTVGSRIFSVAIHPLITVFHRITGFVCVIHDDTAIKKTISELKSRNEELEEMTAGMRVLEEQTRKLAVMEERNILAKEIHDVLGHSLVLAIQTLESNRIIVRNQPEAAVKRLRQVVEDIDRGMEEIAAGKLARGSRISLDSMLGRIARRLAGIGVKLEIVNASPRHNYPDPLSRAALRICQEACTNAIKHGKADYITLSLKEKEGQLQIHIVDNGIGCCSFTKGKGLRGMEERVANLGGCVHFNSFEDGNGFMVHAQIPIES